ncbi:MAG TPA: hypothetical protein VFP30_04635 [Candidatus Limnocylindria bacterium]|nr:hypothetical protein [Candidatus Limnocylindria bacterium]
MIAAAALGLALLAVVATPVAADCQPAGPIQEELPRAEVAFVGTAVDVVGSMATFAVHEVWAGSVAATVEVHGLTSGVEFSEDDRRWEVGSRYLVVPIVEGEVLRDSFCTPTTEWQPELAALRPASAEIIGVDPEETAVSVPPALLLAGMVVLLVAGASAFAFQRR